jgi:hexokinase
MPSKQRDDGRAGEDKYGVEGGPVLGLILGTGLNLAYPETYIPKINFKADTEAGAQIINMESGTFYNRFQGRLDLELDRASKEPGTFTTEKTVAGAYLGNLTLRVWQEAVKEGLLKFDRQDELLKMDPHKLPGFEVNTFMHNPLSRDGLISGLFGDKELDALRSMHYLSDIIVERAAVFAAAEVAGAVTHLANGPYHAGLDPFRPVRIAVEGTTYCIYGQMRRAIEAHLHTMLTADRPLAYRVETVEQASLIGAAVAALSE